MSARIPVELGGRGPVLHLAHGNGFPPGTYRPLAEALADRYRVIALPARPLWPGQRPEDCPTWRPLADDLVEGLDALGLGGILGVGHSLGSLLTFWAAVRRPDLFRAVVLIEPVILPPTWMWCLRLLRCLGLHQRLPLAQRALQRRRTWPSRQACFEHYRRGVIFANWSDRALWAYVEAGTQPRGDGMVELAYPPEWEAHIFATTPIDVWGEVPRLKTRALVIRGASSSTFRHTAERRMARRLPGVVSVTIPDAGHLAPMERPEETAAVIRDFLDGLGC